MTAEPAAHPVAAATTAGIGSPDAKATAQGDDRRQDDDQFTQLCSCRWNISFNIPLPLELVPGFIER
jgi:hypothetical protein